MAKIISMRGKIEILGENLVDLTRALSQDETQDVTWEVADATTDETINLTGITTADVVYIESDQQVTVKINGSATAQTIDANGCLLMWGTAVTAITISNASGSTAVVRRIIVGT